MESRLPNATLKATLGIVEARSHYCPVAPWVVSGPRSFVSHATWRDRTIKAGDCVFLELGGCVFRYQTGMMRSVFVGPPNPFTLDLEKVVKEAMDAVLSHYPSPVQTGAADAAARKVISASGHAVTQYTRVGRSMGLAFPPGWGEGHMIDIKPGDQRLFEEDMTFHLIPFLQVPNLMVVAMSETIHVTKAGCELLTDFDRRVFYA